MMHFAYAVILNVIYSVCRFKMHHLSKNELNYAVMHLLKYAAQMKTINIILLFLYYRTWCEPCTRGNFGTPGAVLNLVRWLKNTWCEPCTRACLATPGAVVDLVQ